MAHCGEFWLWQLLATMLSGMGQWSRLELGGGSLCWFRRLGKRKATAGEHLEYSRQAGFLRIAPNFSSATAHTHAPEH